MRSNQPPAGAKAQQISRLPLRRQIIPGVSMSKAFFLLAAALSFLLSVFLFFNGDRERGIYVGIWVPSVLAAGALLLGKESIDE